MPSQSDNQQDTVKDERIVCPRKVSRRRNIIMNERGDLIGSEPFCTRSYLTRFIFQSINATYAGSIWANAASSTLI